jgi:hypothetical protein
VSWPHAIPKNADGQQCGLKYQPNHENAAIWNRGHRCHECSEERRPGSGDSIGVLLSYISPGRKESKHHQPAERLPLYLITTN